MIDIRAILVRGHLALAAQRKASEAEQAGHPRVGSSGCVTESGEIYGTCHRVALARLLGIDSQPDVETEEGLATDLLWKGGEANEWHWERILSLGLPGEVRVDESGEVSIRAEIDGAPADTLGHPDRVLFMRGGAALFGIELKGIFGGSTARTVYFDKTPKNENLVQAAAYFALSGLPGYALCYTSYCWIEMPYWAQKKYGQKHIKPFYRVFYMEWRDDVLWYRDETETEWVRTVITKEGIKDYYRLLSEMQTAKDLGPRVTGHYVSGEPHHFGEHAQCGLCQFKDACEAYDADKDYDGFLERIRAITKCETANTNGGAAA
jgi:hypothetical protein